MYDGEFINTFLDNVRVPAESLVGKLNGGWECLPALSALSAASWARPSSRSSCVPYR
jgi:alkylation response protein AidB-like acyl-CoA dehydrogenase